MAGDNFQHFWDLVLWQESRNFKISLCRLARSFPVEEKFRLTDQLIRAARSVTTQIAEGHGRFSWKDQLNFCIIGRGSLNEIVNHLYDALDENYINQETFDSNLRHFYRVEVLLNGYIKYLRSKLPPKS